MAASEEFVTAMKELANDAYEQGRIDVLETFVAIANKYGATSAVRGMREMLDEIRKGGLHERT